MDSSLASESADCDCAPIAKRPKKFAPPPPPPPPPPQQLLFIPCYCVESEVFHSIYIVDLSSPPNPVVDDDHDSFTPLAPALRIDCGLFKAYSICVLGSTLYMFQSSIMREMTDPDQLKAVATVDLSRYLTNNNKLLNDNVKLEKDMLSYAPPMLHPKKTPVSTPTPDGRLLVYSSLIRFEPYHAVGAQIDFELYDPRARSWRQLPGIQDHWGRDRKFSCSSFRIQAFAFPSDCVLFVKTEAGMFSLDLDDPRGFWRQVDALADAREVPPQSGRFSVVERELCFTCHCAFDIKTSTGSVCCVFPLTSFADVNKYEMEIPCVVPLVDGDGERSFCFVQTAIESETMYPHMTIDVYRYDLAKYREDKRKSQGFATLSTSHSKSFKFLLNAYQCDSFIPLGLFPVSAQIY